MQRHVLYSESSILFIRNPCLSSLRTEASRIRSGEKINRICLDGRTDADGHPFRSPPLLSSPESRWRLPSMTLRLLRDEKFPILERRTPELFPESAPSDIIGCLSVWCLGSRSKALYGCFLSLPPCRTDRPSRRGVEPSTTKPTNL